MGSLSKPEADARQPWVPLLSLAGLLAGWSLLALAGSDPELLPAPWQIAPLAVQELASGELLRHLGATLARVVLAFVVAMSIGSAIGMIMGRSRRADRWLDPWLIFFLNLPALVTIVLCYLWIGLNEVAAILAVALNKIPTVVVTVREGARALDPALEDMARVFRMDRGARLRHVIVPQLAPFFASAGRSGISLIWKIVLVVGVSGTQQRHRLPDPPLLSAFRRRDDSGLCAQLHRRHAGDRNFRAAPLGSPGGPLAAGYDRNMISVAITEKRYPGTAVLGPIAFDLEAQETLAVTGPSGIGKTTLLRIVAGLDEDFEGRVRGPEHLAMVFQEPTLLPWRSARDNICLTTGAGPEKADALLAEVGLAGMGGRFPHPALARPATGVWLWRAPSRRSRTCC